MDVPDCRKWLVIGSGGAGKSVLARAMAEALALPLVHLDLLYWRPGWSATPREEWERTVEALVRDDAWILDGNYGGTLATRLEACDAVVFLDLPRHLCVWGLVRRRLGRARPDLPPGCRERITLGFLRWVWEYPERTRPGILAALERYRDTKRIHVLRSRREIATFRARIRGEHRER